MQTAATVLGIPIDATPDQAKKAYRKKALTCHPDRHPGAEAQFQQLTEAYETFTHPKMVSVPSALVNPFHFDTRGTFNATAPIVPNSSGTP